MIRATYSVAGGGVAGLGSAHPVNVEARPLRATQSLRATWGRARNFVSRGARRVLNPMAVRTRAFMLEPLWPMLGRVDAIAHDVQAIRHALADPQVADRLSPELAKSIEALLLAVAVGEPRR